MAPIRNNNRQSITAGNGTSKVHLFSQRNGIKSIKFTIEEGSHEFGYTWSKYGKPTKENMQRYACTKCRTIYDASGKNGLAKLPLPAIIFDENAEEFVTLVPANAHFCQGPRNMNEIRGVEAKRTELARVRESRDKPRVAAINLTNQLTRRFGNRPEEVRQEIAAAAMKTKAAFAKAASRASNTDVPKISKISDFNDERHKPSMLTLGGEVRYLSGADGAEEEKHVLWWNERNVILGSPYYTDKFIEADEFFCDGTFLYAPQLPEVPQKNIQLYRIFGLIHETVIVPCFTIIMQKKTEDEYKIVFEAIADIVGRWRLAARIAHFDGETAAVNAFKSIRKFRRIECKMCSFHVRQCLHRHGATLGLTRDYGEETNQFIKRVTTSIGGLQHAPTGILDEAVVVLNDFLDGQDTIDQAIVEKLKYLLNEYFVPTWLQHSLGIEFVSAADVTTNCTNNYAETFHGNQKLFYKQPHAKLGQFLFDDRRLQNCLETEIKLMESGDHDIPEKNDKGDRKRASTRARMMNQLAVANVNRGEIILKYVHRLGKYAGMAGEF